MPLLVRPYERYDFVILAIVLVGFERRLIANTTKNEIPIVRFSTKVLA